MSWQSVARGGILRMHRGAIPRPTGVTSVQNQLRRLCLSTNSTQTRPQLQALLPIRSLVQSNSFVTAPTDAKKAKKSKAKKPKAKKAKKPLTEKQQEAKKIKEEKDHIKQLKETALTLPKKLPFTFQGVAMQTKLVEVRGQYKTMAEAFQKASDLVKTIEGHEKQEIEAKIKENQVANAAAYEAWIKSHTPLQIKQANVARRALLRTLNNRKYLHLKDDRQVKKPTTAYMAYTTERLNSGDYKDKDRREAVRAVGQEWKDVSESDKQRFQKVADEDRARYLREHEEVYGFLPRNLVQKMKAEAAQA